MASLLEPDLDRGEAEVIALAIERHAEVVLLDETDARRVARAYGLRITGVIGLLIRARMEGIVPSLQAELDRLRDRGGFWMSEDLYQRALAEVGEEI